MTKQFPHTLDKFSPNYDSWSQEIAKYFDVYVGNYKEMHDSDLARSITSSTHKIFKSLIELFINNSKIKDKFFYSQVGAVYLPSKEASAQSQKLGANFSLGVYQNEFFLESDIEKPFYLKNMNDGFWSYFFELSLLGNFTVETCSNYLIKETENKLKRIKVTKSNVFKLIHSYIVYNEVGDIPLDLGTLSVKWDLNTPWQVLINNGIKAFNYMYKINYALYRAEYLSTKKHKVEPQKIV